MYQRGHLVESRCPQHPPRDLAQGRCPQHPPRDLGQVLPYDNFSSLIHNLEIGCQNLRGFVSNPDVTLKEQLLLLSCWTRGKEVGYFEHTHTAKTHTPPSVWSAVTRQPGQGLISSLLPPAWDASHLWAGIFKKQVSFPTLFRLSPSLVTD